jgi:hypothetical protein
MVGFYHLKTGARPAPEKRRGFILIYQTMDLVQKKTILNTKQYKIPMPKKKRVPTTRKVLPIIKEKLHFPWGPKL